MSSNLGKRTRSERVASLQTEPGALRQWTQSLTQMPVLLRFGIALLFAVALTVLMRGWQPPFAFRQGYIPPRSIVARVAFKMPDVTKTEVLKAQQSREVICFYENRVQALVQIREAIKGQIYRFLDATSIDQLDTTQRQTLDDLLLRAGGSEEPPMAPQDALSAINSTFADQTNREKLDVVLLSVFQSIEEHGLLKSLTHDIDKGNQRWIRVFPSGQESQVKTFEIERVRIAEVLANLRTKLRTEFRREFNRPEAESVADMVHNFLTRNLPETLTYRSDLSEKARQTAIASVPPAMISFQPGATTLVRGGVPITESDLSVLKAEYDAWTSQHLLFMDQFIRVLAFAGMIAAIYLLCGITIYFQFDRRLLTDPLALTRIIALPVACVVLAGFLSRDPWRAEVIPMVVCAVTGSIAFGRSLALMLITAAALSITLSLGLDVAEFVLLISASAASILLLGRIRTRTRLMWVGLGAAVVTSLTTLGVGVLVGQGGGGSLHDLEPIALTSTVQRDTMPLLRNLVLDAGRQGGFAFVACLLMTGLLPLIERIFDVQTDLRLLELGDASHPLLRQLAQRAPGTYNHSINVAAIAEAAADTIGANGLLTRVGAYFHDIGKMFKPNYFVENQGQGPNSHDSLQPAMSTLVIIAHVKDGADLARQHHLPKPLVDFVEQHHGTTLVEYFYNQAAKRSEENPNGEEVSELNFRYPGPKPQFVEAAILMLADAVESASRTLVEPTPSRIESLVSQIAMKRLLDGQFDECGLTLKQLELVKRSLVKSLTAIYHGRVKYPGQQSA